MDKHSRAFFGQTTAVIVNSSSKAEDNVFLKFIKKLPSGAWEKPSLGQGKTISCSLEEMICILKVLRKEWPKWNTYHKHAGRSSKISFNWAEDQDTLWINVGKYGKMLSEVQVELFRMLMEHLLEEKVAFATKPQFSGDDGKPAKKRRFNTPPENTIKKASPVPEVKKPARVRKNGGALNRMTGPSNNAPRRNVIEPSSVRASGITRHKDKSAIKAIIIGVSPKALNLRLRGGAELWLPRSTVHSTYDEGLKDVEQPLAVDNWVLEKNGLI